MSWILEEDDHVEKEKRATEELLKLITPSFWDMNQKDNAEQEIEVGFEEFMLSVAEHTKENLETITTFKFYTLLEFIKNKNNNNG